MVPPAAGAADAATVAGATDMATALRTLCVMCGSLLLVRAVAMAWRGTGRRPPGTPASRSAPRLLGRVVAVATRLCATATPPHRSSDETTLLTRLAAAPASWPARWVAAGLTASRQSVRTTTLSGLMCGVRCLCALAVAAACSAPALLLTGAAGIALAPFAAAAGAALPDVALARAARRASRMGEGAVAAALDLLAATTSAGLPLEAAMELTAGHAPPPVAAALHAAAARRAMGEEPAHALTVESARFRIPALADVSLAVERQRRLGTSLGPELRHIAARLRAEHRARTLERITRRAPLATLVVALVIAPLCLAALIACLVGGMVQSGTL
jgi:Flp pilus assembly protein TadB